MWRQAQTTGTMSLVPLVGNGWSKDERGKLAIDWDSNENLTKIRNRVDLVLKGCSCKGGCSTNRCGCRRKGIPCGVGCGCTGCVNKEDQHETISIMPVDSNTDSSTDESDTEQNDDLDTYVNKIMKCLDNGKFQPIIIAVKRSMTDYQPLILLFLLLGNSTPSQPQAYILVIDPYQTISPLSFV